MSKLDSYYDWELQFRKKTMPSVIEIENQNNKSRLNRDIDQAKMKVNSLGIIDKDFKEFIKKWKMKNF